MRLRVAADSRTARRSAAGFLRGDASLLRQCGHLAANSRVALIASLKAAPTARTAVSAAKCPPASSTMPPMPEKVDLNESTDAFARPKHP